MCCNRLASKFVPVEEAETAIARANGAPVLTAATVPHADGLPLSRDPSAAQVGSCYMPLTQNTEAQYASHFSFHIALSSLNLIELVITLQAPWVAAMSNAYKTCSAASGVLQALC